MKLKVPKKNIMIDIETMSSKPKAAIVQIGAVYYEEGKEKSSFNEYISPESAGKYGHVDAETMEWWNGQKPETQEIVFGGDTILPDAIGWFCNWVVSLSHKADIAVWGNPPQFDLVILRNAMDATGHDYPWAYYQERCYRTVRELTGTKRDALPRAGNHHDGLDDARYQMDVLYHMLNTDGGDK